MRTVSIVFPYEVPGSINAQGIPNSIAAFGVCVLMHVYKNHMIKVKAGIAILQTNYFSAIQCIQCEHLGISLQHLQSGHNHVVDQWG